MSIFFARKAEGSFANLAGSSGGFLWVPATSIKLGSFDGFIRPLQISAKVAFGSESDLPADVANESKTALATAHIRTKKLNDL